MTRLRFSDLIEVYRNTSFAEEGDKSTLTIQSSAIIALLKLIEKDDVAAADANIALLDSIDEVRVDATVHVRIGPPRIGLGILAWTLDGLLKAPAACLEEPKHFFLIKPRFAPGDLNVPNEVTAYRRVLKLVALFSEAAAYLDRQRSDLVFVKESKIVIPVRFNAVDLMHTSAHDADRLLSQFQDELHREQKLEILSEALVNLSRARSTSDRFAFLLRNLSDLADEVRDGYKLFASNFSYNKIRNELENARIEYTAKIHKTIVDIQNQLLGIPVATVVVAAQMKPATSCTSTLWTDIAVLAGAWIFVLLLLIAITNQWLTLNVIRDELTQQRSKLEKNYATISDQFIGIFESLGQRLLWHRLGLLLVGSIAAFGAIATTFIFNNIVQVSVWSCVATSHVIGS